MEDTIRSLNAELALPSASRLQAALRKRGVSATIDQVKAVVETTGTRQVLQPPPRYDGNITAAKIDDRWVADLLSFETRPAQRSAAVYKQILLVQDIFSRFLWAIPLTTKAQTTNAFETLLEGRKPRELNTDKGSEFTSREFQAMLARRNIQHRLKEGLNDLATLDRGMGVIKDMLAKRMGEMGGDWLTHVDKVADAYNQLDNRTLHGHSPAEVQGADADDLRFRLRMDNADKMLDNIQNARRKQNN